MKHFIKKIIIPTLLCTLLFLLYSENASAEDLSYELHSTIIPVVEDRADLFSDYEEIVIRDKFTQLRDKSGHQFVFMTVNDTIGYIKGREIESMFNQHQGQLYGNGSVFLLINTDTGNLMCDVMAFSYAKDYLTPEICEYITGELRTYAKEGKYSECMDAFFDYYNQAYDGTLDIKNITADNESAVMSFVRNNLVLLIIILLSSVVITLIIFFILGRKLQNNTKAYSSNSFVGPYDIHVHITTDKLTYIRSRVSK